MAGTAYFRAVASKDAAMTALQIIHIKVASERIGDLSVVRRRITFTIYRYCVDKLRALRDETVKHRPQQALIGFGVAQVVLLGLLPLVSTLILFIEKVQPLRL